MALAANRYDDAIRHFEQAESLGNQGWLRDHAEAYLALRRPDVAARIAAKQEGKVPGEAAFESRMIEVTLPLDRGQWTEALAAARKLEVDAKDAGELARGALALATLSLRSYAPDDALRADLRRRAELLPQQMEAADSLRRRHLLFQAMALGWMAAHTGDLELARRMRALGENETLVERYPANLGMRRALDAEIALAEGKPAEAIAALADEVQPGAGTYFSRAVLMRAQRAAGNDAEAIVLAQWLAENRGRAFAEPSSLSAWQPANVIESTLALKAWSQLAAANGEAAVAETQAAAFAAAWPDDAGAALVERRDRRR
jgi:hypothetical protein